ncbi:hypothetical protein K1719_000042 [Acacia pycnantha]|nr:hypothetical protein K1719_000042 [Acacia pycnantha]
MVDDQLYRKGLHTPMLRCLGTNESRYVLAEIHGGINGQNMGAKALARKALRAGRAPYHHHVGKGPTLYPTEHLLPFRSPGRVRNRQRHPIYRQELSGHYGRPRNNASLRLGRTPLIKRSSRGTRRVEHRIMSPIPRRLRTLEEGEESNSKALATEMELVDEVRTTAHCRDMAAKQLIAAKYNREVRPRAFDRGDLVLRRADVGNKNAKDGKLAANWDGPYRVKERLDKGAYVLETLARKPIKRTWNADKLRVYYS